MNAKWFKLGDEEITRIAAWDSVHSGFDREVSTITRYIRPMLDRLQGLDGLTIYEFEDGGRSNYFAFFVYDKREGTTTGTDLNHCGVVVYLSLLAPVAVIGLSEIRRGANWNSIPHLQIGLVIEPDMDGGELLALVHASLLQSDYTILGPEQINQRLPPDVKPYEYCLCDEPWDRYFHALFANTD